MNRAIPTILLTLFVLFPSFPSEGAPQKPGGDCARIAGRWLRHEMPVIVRVSPNCEMRFNHCNVVAKPVSVDLDVSARGDISLKLVEHADDPQCGFLPATTKCKVDGSMKDRLDVTCTGWSAGVYDRILD
jgi:hypothetical protein